MYEILTYEVKKDAPKMISSEYTQIFRFSKMETQVKPRPINPIITDKSMVNGLVEVDKNMAKTLKPEVIIKGMCLLEMIIITLQKIQQRDPTPTSFSKFENGLYLQLSRI